MAEVARNDNAPAVRRMALRRINDLALLEELARTDSDRGVRETAVKRHWELLAGDTGGGPALDARLELLARAEDDALIEYLALQGKEDALRAAALERVQKVSILAKVAINDPVPAMRLAALERINDKSTLKSVLKNTRTRDKKVSRRAREKLDALSAALERPKRIQAKCEQICVSAEHLGSSGEWERDHTRYEHLQRQWQEVAEEAKESHRSRFAKARKHFLAGYERYQVHAPIRAARQDLTQRLETVLGGLHQSQPPDDSIRRSAKTTLTEAEAAWEQLAPLPNGEDAALRVSFDQVRTAIQARLSALSHERRYAALCEDAEQMLSDSHPITEQQVKALERRWRSARGVDEDDLPGMARRFETVRQALRDRLRRQLEQRKEDLAALPGELDALEAALDGGESKRARALHDRIQTTLKNLTDMGTGPEKLTPLRERAAAVAPRLREMRDWAQWGSDGARERLCQEMETLVDSDEDPREIARQVRKARSEWQALAPGDPANSEILWRRFQKAARSAYKPSKRYFRDQAQARRSNLERKEELCQELEEFLAATDWSQMDWKRAVRFQRGLINEWHRAGPVERKFRKGLEHRLRAGLDPLNSRLEEERERNRRYREDVIERIESLKTDKEPLEAVAECRRLRKEWVTTVPGSRKEENALWEKFCTACDDVFANRQRMLDEKDQALRANLDRKQALCAELESLLPIGPDTLEGAEHQFHLAQSTWKEIGPVPKSDVARLEARFAAAQSEFESHRQTLRKRAQRAQLESLHQRAELCARAENVVHGDNPEQALNLIETLRAQWSALRSLEQKGDEDAMRGRFEQACEAALGNEDALATRARVETRSRERREALCIRMEILAGIDSPPEFAQARMAYQVSRLSDAMSGGEERPPDQWEELVRDWCLEGPAPPGAADALETRFQRASHTCADGI